MKYYVIKKSGEKDVLSCLIAGTIKWRVRKYLHNGKRTRNPPNINSIDVGDRFLIYFRSNKERLFYASGFLASKNPSENSYELSFYNQSGKGGFDEFLRKPNFAELKEKIVWRPIQGDIQRIEESDYKTIISNAGIEIPPEGYESENKSNSKGKKKDSRKNSVDTRNS